MPAEKKQGTEAMFDELKVKRIDQLEKQNTKQIEKNEELKKEIAELEDQLSRYTGVSPQKPKGKDGLFEELKQKRIENLEK